MNPPALVDDAVATLGGAVVSIPVTANDTGTITSIAIAAAPAHGTATVNGLEVAYTPEAGFTGTDRFHYIATGPGGTSAPATVTVTVNPLPVAVSRRLRPMRASRSGGPAEAPGAAVPPPTGTLSTANAAQRHDQVDSGDAARYVLTTPGGSLPLARALTWGNAYADFARRLEFDVTARRIHRRTEVRACWRAAASPGVATAQINNSSSGWRTARQGRCRSPKQVSFSETATVCEKHVGASPVALLEPARNEEAPMRRARPPTTASPGNAFGTGSWRVCSGTTPAAAASRHRLESDGPARRRYRVNGKFASVADSAGPDDAKGRVACRSEGKPHRGAVRQLLRATGLRRGLMGTELS